VFKANAVDPLVTCIKEGTSLLQAILALGNIANFSENFADKIIQLDIVPYLYDIIVAETRQDHIQVCESQQFSDLLACCYFHVRNVGTALIPTNKSDC
jgi:hypothetical protein